MDATDDQVKISLRIQVDGEKNKVLFAEADSDFVDTLLSFLTLPMGTITRIVKKHCDLQPGEIGSFKNLYGSVEVLHAKHLWSGECKEMLLHPRNASEEQCQQLKLNLDDTGVTKYFICENRSCCRGDTAFLSSYNTIKCNCGKFMNREMSIDSCVNKDGDKGRGGVFVSETSSFIVTDDLHVLPNLPTSAVELLKKFGYRDMNAVDEINLNVGFKEMLNLLKFSLHSKSPMTDTFLSKRLNVSGIGKSKLRCSTEKQMGKRTQRTFNIKIVVQKSSNKVLFAQAQEDFVDFLFGLLTIPLGALSCALSGDISVGSTGNLYTSVLKLDNREYDIKSQKLKEMLANPQMASLHLCKNQVFYLCEAKFPQYYCNSKHLEAPRYLTRQKIVDRDRHHRSVPLYLKDPNMENKYTKPAMFVVTDELAVSPLSSFSAVSFFQKSNVQLSDVEEHVVSIGLEEAQKIVKAAFESSSVLTSAGLNDMAKHIKQERA